MILALAMVALAVGDHWKFDVAIHYENRAEAIDMKDLEQLEFKVLSASDAGYHLSEKRTFLGSQMPDVFAPATPGAKPEIREVATAEGAHNPNSTSLDTVRLDRILWAIPFDRLPDTWERTYSTKDGKDTEATVAFKLESHNAIEARLSLEYKEPLTRLRANASVDLELPSHMVKSMTFSAGSATIPGGDLTANLTIEVKLAEQFLKKGYSASSRGVYSK